MRKQIISIVAIEALLGLLTTPKAMTADLCNTVQIQPVTPQNGSSLSGFGTLGVNNRQTEVSVMAGNLTPGVAYTAWFIYFDNIAQCLTPLHCGPPDAIMPATNPAGVFGRMDSAVAGRNGQLTFKGSLRDLRVSAGSAVHIALFDHGPANTSDNGARARQLLTPETPGLGAPGLGVGTEKGFLVAFVAFDIGSCR